MKEQKLACDDRMDTESDKKGAQSHTARPSFVIPALSQCHSERSEGIYLPESQLLRNGADGHADTTVYLSILDTVCSIAEPQRTNLTRIKQV